MRRLLLVATLAAAGLSGSLATSSNAVCAGTIVCGAQSTCYGIANVCPGANSCYGTVNVCPDANSCGGGVNICNVRASQP